MASSSSSLLPKPSIGILSVGDMGMGVAKLLRAHDYPVLTTAYGRSQRTKDRIKAASIVDVSSDEDLIVEADIILSIVPPRDAVATAKRVHSACKAAAERRNQSKGFGNLFYFDLNAISPSTSRKIAALFVSTEPERPSVARRLSKTLRTMSSGSQPVVDVRPVTVRYLDGGIIGGPPSLQTDKSWKRPSIVISGPKHDVVTPDLIKTLNMKVISDEIGAASTLKACFATFGKGIYALAIASFTTAHTAGVLPELQDHLKRFFPSIYMFVEDGLPDTPPKAYRWVDEMKEIGETMTQQGFFQANHEGQAVLEGISEIYKLMADDTVLGKEIIGKRKRGTTVEDVAESMRAGLEAKRNKQPSEEKLDMAWKSSWT